MANSNRVNCLVANLQPSGSAGSAGFLQLPSSQEACTALDLDESQLSDPLQVRDYCVTMKACQGMGSHRRPTAHTLRCSIGMFHELCEGPVLDGIDALAENECPAVRHSTTFSQPS